jgi:hypothetical protein
MTSSQSRAVLWRYVIKHDTGLAPHIANGMCSLTVCKPKIRQYAKPGEWIMAFAPRAESKGNPLVKYLLKVGSNPPFETYCRDHFGKRRDALYRYDAGWNGQWFDNGHGDHPPSEIGQAEKDKRGLHALVGTEYFHFGSRPRNLLFELMPFCEKRGLSVDSIVAELVHSTQGQSKYCSNDALAVFLAWVGGLPKSSNPPATHPLFPPEGFSVAKAKDVVDVTTSRRSRGRIRLGNC